MTAFLLDFSFFRFFHSEAGGGAGQEGSFGSLSPPIRLPGGAFLSLLLLRHRCDWMGAPADARIGNSDRLSQLIPLKRDSQLIPRDGRTANPSFQESSSSGRAPQRLTSHIASTTSRSTLYQAPCSIPITNDASVSSSRSLTGWDSLTLTVPPLRGRLWKPGNGV
jgi:hypothetical protein